MVLTNYRVYDFQFLISCYRSSEFSCQNTKHVRWTIWCANGNFREPTGSWSNLLNIHKSFDSGMPIPITKGYCASNPADAKRIMKSAIRDDNPVIFMESEQMYGDKGEFQKGVPVPIGSKIVQKVQMLPFFFWKK